jgi:hypothetical protein
MGEVHSRPAWQPYLMQRVGDNPDNLVIGITARNDVEMLAQRIFPGEILLRQLVADHNRLRGGRYDHRW